MTALLTPAEVGAILSVKDPRTTRRRLVEFAVPVVPFGRSYRVRAADLERSIAAAVVVVPDAARTTGNNATLAPGARLWDPEPVNQVGPRRENGRPRGTRTAIPVQRDSTDGSLAVPAALPCAPPTGEESS